jgi:hypothetical protein
MNNPITTAVCLLAICASAFAQNITPIETTPKPDRYVVITTGTNFKISPQNDSVSDPTLPNQKLTPGAARPEITLAIIKSTKWGKDERHVDEALKKKVFAAYGIPWSQHRLYEVDHLVPREVGGADVFENLWPEPYNGPWNAHMKDRVENRMNVLVCSGKLDLKQAQDDIKTNWITCYKRIFGTP